METIEFTVDGTLRESAQQVLAEEGLTIPEAFSMFLRSVVHDGAMPEVYRTPNAATLAAMKDAEEGKLHNASSVSEFMRSLREDN